MSKDILLIDAELYVSYALLVQAGISENTLRQAKARQSNSWKFINDPKDDRRVLCHFASMTAERQEQVRKLVGNPYNQVTRLPILQLVEHQATQLAFFKAYTYDQGKHLPPDVVRKYSRAADWLTMLERMQKDRKLIKTSLCLSVPEFYGHVGELIGQEKAKGKRKDYAGHDVMPGDFPTTYQRLGERVKKWMADGPASLIDPMFGNKVAAKIGKTADGFDAQREREQIAIIRSAASDHRNLDAAQVANIANNVFRKQGMETVTHHRVKQLLQEWGYVITPGQRGRRVFDSTMAMQHSRKRPSHPLYYLTLDGWTVELAYLDDSDTPRRLVAVVVLDPCNDYPVGWAIGTQENTDLIRQANRSALAHIRELFGDYYQPHQLQSDHYGLKSLTPFYNAMAHLVTPAAVGNAKAKVVEPYFKTINKRYCQLLPNWTGHNLDASKANQVNREMHDLLKMTFPREAQLRQQIDYIFNQERKTKAEGYLQAWAEMPAARRVKMSEADLITVFATERQQTLRVEGHGLRIRLDGERRTYDTFDPAFRTQQHLEWTVLVDWQNLSRVLAVSPDGRQRFVLEEKHRQAMALVEQTAEDAAYGARIDAYNKERKQEIINLYAEDATIVQDVIGRPSLLQLTDHEELQLKGMYTIKGQQKDGLSKAKRLGNTTPPPPAPAHKAPNYLTSKTDYSEYLTD